MIENFIAGGTEFMSDVPIRHSRKMRSIMLQSTKAKTFGAKMALFGKVKSSTAITDDFTIDADIFLEVTSQSYTQNTYLLSSWPNHN